MYIKKILVPLVFLICLLGVFASDTEEGRVFIEVRNNPPFITNLEIIPDPFEDGLIECVSDFEDELSEIHITYRWYKNNHLLNKTGSSLRLTNFRNGDIVSCEAIPYDFVQYGESKIISKEVIEKPLSKITGAFIGPNFRGEGIGLLIPLSILLLFFILANILFHKKEIKIFLR